MKKIKYILLAVLVALTLGSLTVHAQADSAVVFINTDGSANTAAINNAVQTVILPSLFNLMGHNGINVTPFAGLIIMVVMSIIRYFEKRKLKLDHAETLKSIVNSPNNKLERSHEGYIRRIIDKLEGKEPLK